MMKNVFTSAHEIARSMSLQALLYDSPGTKKKRLTAETYFCYWAYLKVIFPMEFEKKISNHIRVFLQL